MKKVNIAIIVAGSETIGNAIKHHILLKECATVVVHKPMGNGKTTAETPVKKYTFSGTFDGISEEHMKALERLSAESERANGAFQEAVKSAKEFKRTQFEKPRSKYHK